MPIAKLPEGFPEPKPLPTRYWEDEKWLEENIVELTRRYPDQWIAVLNRQVVAANRHLGEVNKIAYQREEEVGQGQCVYEFVEGGVRIYAPKPLV